MTRRASRKWLTGPLFGLRDVGTADIAFAVTLGTFGVALTSGLIKTSHPHGGWAASIAVLLMTLPVVYARRLPVAAAGTLAAGAAVNFWFFGHMVRCGPALPAVFYVAFVLGSRCGWRAIRLGMAYLVANLVCQVLSDPNLKSSPPALNLVLFVPLTVAFMFAGRLLHAHSAAVVDLRARTEELRQQREQNAGLAVRADRARIAGDLDDFLHERVREIAATAAVGRATLDTHPDDAQSAFVAIQGTGRGTLMHMREVVGGLRDQAPTEPQPVLAQLDRLLGQATAAEARLQVRGDPRLLPAGVELSGYRIVEQLLLALENDPAARVDVVVVFGPEALELTVSGPSTLKGDARAALAAATERATVLGGTLRAQYRNGRREVVVLLPLATGHG